MSPGRKPASVMASGNKASPSSRKNTATGHDPLLHMLPGIAYTVEIAPDGARKIVEISDALEKTLGFSPNAWMSDASCWERQIHPDDVGWVLDAIAKAEANAGVRAFEYRLLHCSGEIFWFRDLAFCLTTPGDYPLRYRGFLLNITTRKRTEQAMIRTSFSAQQHAESLERLAAGIAHDFNNLLTSILGHAQILAMELPENHPHQEYVQHIQSAGERAAHVVERLVSFSKRPTDSLVPIDLNEWLKEIAPRLRKAIPATIAMEITTPPPPSLWVRGSKEHLETSLLNLISNAVNAIEKGGHIHVLLDAVEIHSAEAASLHGSPGSYARVSIRDNGKGICPRNLSKIFEPFYTTLETGKGMGLGLAIVQTTAKNHRGFIHVTSEPGLGARFDLHLPRISPGMTEELQEPQTVLPQGDATILYIEGNPVEGEATTQLLQSLGYRVLRAATAAEAILIFENYPRSIALVFTDVVTADIHGIKLIERLRKIRDHFKVLYFSDSACKKDKHPRCESIQANFLQKPFEFQSLATAIRHALE